MNSEPTLSLGATGSDVARRLTLRIDDVAQRTDNVPRAGPVCSCVRAISAVPLVTATG